jgi:hypothetical protein
VLSLHHLVFTFTLGNQDGLDHPLPWPHLPSATRMGSTTRCHGHLRCVTLATSSATR